MPSLPFLRLGAVAVLAFCAAVLSQALMRASDVLSPRGVDLLESVVYTLENQPLLKIQQERVLINRGAQLQASSIFDTLISSGIAHSQIYTPLALSSQQQLGLPSDLSSGTTGYSVGGSRLFRNGISVSPGLSVARDVDNNLQSNGLSTSHLGVTIDIPLLRGRGRSVVAATEMAAATETRASQFDVTQLAAQLITSTVTSYWNFVAAFRTLVIAQDAESRGKTYVQNIQALIEADRVPRSDLHVVKANWAQRSGARIAAEQQVVAAREQLALDMGVRSDEMFDTRGPTDDFPSGEDVVLPSDRTADLRIDVGEAFRRRADLLASQRREAEQNTLLVAAENSLRPQLDVVLSSGFSGLREGLGLDRFLVAPGSNIKGLDTTAGLNFSFPRQNNLAVGKLLQVQAAKRQSALATAELSREISAAVILAVKAVRHNSIQLKDARESVEDFQSALSAEREKYRLGMGSVINILTVEDQLNQSLQTEVQADLAYAVSLTNLRLATGTIIPPELPIRSAQIERSTFFTLPALISLERQP